MKISYKFTELDDKAKIAACDDYLINTDYDTDYLEYATKLAFTESLGLTLDHPIRLEWPRDGYMDKLIVHATLCDGDIPNLEWPNGVGVINTYDNDLYGVGYTDDNGYFILPEDFEDSDIVSSAIEAAIAKATEAGRLAGKAFDDYETSYERAEDDFEANDYEFYEDGSFYR